MVTLIVGALGLAAIGAAVVWRGRAGRLIATGGLALCVGAIVLGALGQRHWVGCGAEVTPPPGVSLSELRSLGVDTTLRRACPRSSPLGLRDPF